MASARVFLCYSSKDRRKVRQFERYLRLAGLETWRDEKDLVPGSPILDRIRTGIVTESDFVVVFLTPASLNSQWVRTEIRLAYQRELELARVVVIPVLLGDCEIPPELGLKKYVDARGGVRKPAEEILSAVKWHTMPLEPKTSESVRSP